jgi:hypothetical protein
VVLLQERAKQLRIRCLADPKNPQGLEIQEAAFDLE